jgi:hypothetical protein
MVKLLPKIGSCKVPDALTRQVSVGNVKGKKTVKSRSRFTVAQLVIVLTTLVGVAVAVPLLSAPAVADAVSTTVTLAVAAGVGVGIAPSSRKIMNGFPHQRKAEMPMLPGVVVATAAPPRPEPEHAISNPLNRPDITIYADSCTHLRDIHTPYDADIYPQGATMNINVQP